MMKKITVFLHLLVAVYLTGCVAGQSKFEPTIEYTREAISSGQVREFLTAMEALGVEAHSKQRWAEAASAYTQAATAAGNLGQLQKSIEYGTKAVELAQKARAPDIQTTAISSLSVAYRNVGKLDKEREWLKKGMEATRQMPQGVQKETFQAMWQRKLGQNYLVQRETKEGIEYLAYSVQTLDSVVSYLRRNGRNSQGGQTQLFLSLDALGEAYLQASNLQEAIETFERAVSLYETAKLRNNNTNVFLGLGQAYLAQWSFVRSRENFSKALELAEARGQTSQIAMSSSGLGEVFFRIEKPIEALSHYKKAINTIESTRSLLESEDLRTSFFKDKVSAYEGIIKAQVGANDLAGAYNYNERARSRAFLDLVGSKAQLSRFKSNLIEDEKALQQRIAASRANPAGQDEGAGDDAGLRNEIAAAEQAYNVFLAKVQRQDKEQASLMSVEPLALKQVQELLDPGQTMLEYFVTENDVFAWVVEKDKLESRRVSLPKAELTNQIKILRELISNVGDQRQLNELSSVLYQKLIEPVAEQITGKELIIVPHDVLHYLPFQALVAADGRYLIEKYPIDYLSSASLLQFAKEKRRGIGEKVLALGNPDLGDPKLNLEYAEAEGKEIKSLYPEATVLFEKEATEEKAKALASESHILHFASHAELNENDPLSSAILLAKSGKEDGRLEVREIFGMDLHASLVVLSACETGLGKLSSGDELVGLTRAFIYAGTPSVVASLWSVDDSSTAHLMSNFYRNLKTMSKVEALQQAQLQLIRGEARSDLLVRRGIGGVGRLGEVSNSLLDTSGSQSETPSSALPAPISFSVFTSHPYFWAPFILVGDGK